MKTVLKDQDVSPALGRQRTPVYQSLLDEMAAKIRQGDVRPGEKLGTEVALADRSGISRMSVRRAVEQLIGEGLVERRQGKGLYVRDPAKRMRPVQVIMPSMAFDQCVQITQGTQALAAERGIQVQIYDAHARIDWDIEVIRQLPQSPMQGAIIASWHHRRFATALYELNAAKFPFVLVDEQLRDIDVPSVVVDNYGGGYRAGQELLAAGHQRIGFIGKLAADTVRARLEGLRDAVADAKLPFDRSLVFDLPIDVPAGMSWEQIVTDVTTQLVQRPDRPSAIFFSDDYTALRGCQAIKSLGLSIPHHLSVVGFDDNPVCEWMEPALSTVRQPGAAMGRAAMEMLLNRMSDPRRPVEHRVLPIEWVPRASIGPRPTGRRAS